MRALVSAKEISAKEKGQKNHFPCPHYHCVAAVL
jgi:hypothetical protein